MNIINAIKLAYEYKRYGEDGQVEETIRAVDGVDLDVKKGDFVAILGHNGSGKSTLAKQLNALLVPTEGTLYVDGMDTKDPDKVWDIRQSAGMVFQNPDNQIIGSVVDEDVGFGPENMGIPTEEIWQRVEESLRSVGMWEYRHSSPNKLSGGQKQRVAIAGVVAMHPKCIVLDEPTAMLDPVGRKDVIRTVFPEEGLFDWVQGQSGAFPRKPDPAGALYIAEQLGVKPEECMYLGDTSTDMKTGTAAGMYTVGVLWGFREERELRENGSDAIAGQADEIARIYRKGGQIHD